ncbi:hypothetical protein O181_105794 [Austropuccinia psidii MF-1]|uniref:Uncharacterized protein n=1 Tax=Austropuccinia psidii MF-1 TaxID=1389203 RepID=A0A9Q3JQU6_9BASI|nr:hypothetical protein [Austropuccinia psidii MF-1]
MKLSWLAAVVEEPSDPTYLHWGNHVCVNWLMVKVPSSYFRLGYLSLPLQEHYILWWRFLSSNEWTSSSILSCILEGPYKFPIPSSTVNQVRLL